MWYIHKRECFFQLLIDRCDGVILPHLRAGDAQCGSAQLLLSLTLSLSEPTPSLVVRSCR
jgi:hypothetical protein